MALYIEAIKLTPNPVYTSETVTIEVEIYTLFPAETLYPAEDLYPGEDIFGLFPYEYIYPGEDVYPTEGGIIE